MNNEAGLDWDTDLIKMGDSDTYIPSPTPPSNLIGIQRYDPTRRHFHLISYVTIYKKSRLAQIFLDVVYTKVFSVETFLKSLSDAKWSSDFTNHFWNYTLT